MKRPSVFRRLRPPGTCSARGFSGIELIVVVSVSLLLTAFALGWSASSRNRIGLTVERTHIIQLLQRAKSLAFSTYSQTSPACGYGMVFGGQNYVLMRYVDPVCTNGLAVGGTDEAIEGGTLPPSVQFGTGPNQVVRVIFLPPDPKVFMYNVGAAVIPEGFIYLTTPSGDSTSTIHITGGGAIEFF